jgi:putative intracellular protease/amidase
VQRGLEGRRIAVAVLPDDDSVERRAAVVAHRLEQAGSRIHLLIPGDGANEDWQGAKYAAVVIVGDGNPSVASDRRLVQLVREFLASEKPVAAFGGGVRVILEAKGAAGRTVAAHGPLRSAVEAAGGTGAPDSVHVDGCLITAQGGAAVEEFASRVVREFSSLLEERELDEMSELSFPASDPPATSPGSIGHVAPDRDSDARP